MQHMLIYLQLTQFLYIPMKLNLFMDINNPLLLN